MKKRSFFENLIYYAPLLIVIVKAAQMVHAAYKSLQAGQDISELVSNKN